MSSIDTKIKELLESSKSIKPVHDIDSMSQDELKEFVGTDEFLKLSESKQLDIAAKAYDDKFQDYLDTLDQDDLKEFTQSDEFENVSEQVKEMIKAKLEESSDKDEYISYPSTDKKKKSKKTAETMEMRSEDIDMSKDVSALIEGEELSDEFKDKASAIFEAAVISRVKTEFSRLQEEFETKLEEQVEEAKDVMVEKLDEYLDYVVEQWIQENQIAIESGLKNEITESFISGMKSLFESHYIDVPEEKRDIFSELAEQVESNESRMNDLFEANIELRKQLTEMRKTLIIKTASEGMTDTDAERLFELSEDISYTSDESFVKKINHIKESYFSKDGKAKPIVETKSVSPVSDTPVILNEDYDGPMPMYLRALTRSTV